ncbi:MAG: redox-sensing transcriptional repressor Rex, partial [Bacteroidales bacterium]|nr:redox-sensing transcriptional repressor Rex [Bacteroidales bacterium]
IAPLLDDLEEYLGYNNLDEALIVGVGSLGRALLAYEAFEQYGLSIVVGFDCDDGLAGFRVGGKPVLPMSKLADMVRRLGIRIGIITVPKEQAQSVCDALIEAGVKAIWNFAPVHLEVPGGVLLKNENLAASLAALSYELRNATKSHKE